jgi:hypothetical protein
VASCAHAGFEVAATGTPPIDYQWSRDGVPIPGADGALYVVPAAEPSDDRAAFWVSVSNAAGSVTSDAATLRVAPPDSPPSGPATIVSEDATSVGVGSDRLVWTSGDSVHTTSAWCPGAVRSIQSGVASSEVVVAGNVAYWADSSPGGGGVFASALEGDLVTLVARSAFEIGGFNAFQGTLVWTDSVGQEIQTMPMAGGPVTHLGIAPVAGSSGPGVIASNGDSYYYADWNGTSWSDVQQVSLNRLPLGGGVPEVLAPSQGVISAIASDGPNVYWIATEGLGASLVTTLRKVSEAGGAIQELAARPGSVGGKLLIDGEFVYWTTSAMMTPNGSLGSGSLERVPADGSAPSTVLVGGLTFAAGVAIDDRFVYWTEYSFAGVGRGRVGRLAR